MYTVESKYYKNAVIVCAFDDCNRIPILIHLSRIYIANMQKRILACLFGVLFFVGSNYSLRLSVVDGDGDDSNDGDDSTVNTRKVAESVGKPLVRRQFFDLNNLLQRRQSSGFTTGQRQYQQYALEAHNKYRARHCVSPLQLDDSISRSAQNYAEYLASINRMIHSGAKGLGENLFMKWSSAVITSISGK